LGGRLTLHNPVFATCAIAVTAMMLEHAVVAELDA
jgi:hypothetical protein